MFLIYAVIFICALILYFIFYMSIPYFKCTLSFCPVVFFKRDTMSTLGRQFFIAWVSPRQHKMFTMPAPYLLKTYSTAHFFMSISSTHPFSPTHAHAHIHYLTLVHILPRETNHPWLRPTWLWAPWSQAVDHVLLFHYWVRFTSVESAIQKELSVYYSRIYPTISSIFFMLYTTRY